MLMSLTTNILTSCICSSANFCCLSLKILVFFLPNKFNKLFSFPVKSTSTLIKWVSSIDVTLFKIGRPLRISSNARCQRPTVHYGTKSITIIGWCTKWLISYSVTRHCMVFCTYKYGQVSPFTHLHRWKVTVSWALGHTFFFFWALNEALIHYSSNNLYRNNNRICQITW